MTSVARICEVGGCRGKHYAKGYCNPHYQRHRAGIPLDGDFRVMNPSRGCKAPKCRRPHGQNGYCQAHNKRAREGRSLEAPLQVRGVHLTCIVPDCNRPHHATGMCSKHDRVCRNFNISLIQYLAIQDLGCSICESGGNLHIDHDHTCCNRNGVSCGSCIRGGLCPNCNVGLGMFGESPVKLRGAIKYLSKNGIVE